jgi:hypothetical protein
MAFKIARIIAAILLVVALGDHPYDYYVLLRFLVCGVCGYGAYYAFRKKEEVWTWTFAIIALLFNPIIPIHLARGTWAIIDLAAAVVLLVSLRKVH